MSENRKGTTRDGEEEEKGGFFKEKAKLLQAKLPFAFWVSLFEVEK